MSYAINTEQARKAMQEAEEKLRDHLNQFAFNVEEGQRLSVAAKLARQQFVDQLESLCPAFLD
jgi:hypothetical protein